MSILSKKISPFTHKRILRLALLIAGCLLIGLLYYFFNPEESLYAPKCLIHSLTGLNCPGCGSQRMFHSLLHADFSHAFEANPFLLIISPFLLIWIWIELDSSTYPKVSRFLNSIPSIISLLILLLIWTILRNILAI